MKPFANLTAIVTGAASGIGHAIALALMKEGGSVCGVDRNAAALEALLADWPDQFRPVPCDLMKASHWTAWLQNTAPPHLLVNAAGISLQSDLSNESDPAWDEIMAVNLNAARLASTVLSTRMERGSKIVNITSVHAWLVERNNLAYGVAKAALGQMTRALAVELAPKGILVNALAPGFVDTPMSRATGVNELETEGFKQNYLESGRIPLQRAAEASEIAAAALFLLSPGNTYITGQTLVVDGGLSLTL